MFYEAEPSIEILQGTELELNKILLNHFDKLRIKPRGEGDESDPRPGYCSYPLCTRQLSLNKNDICLLPGTGAFTILG